MNNNDFMAADIIKDVFKQEVSKKIDDEIDKKVKEFREELVNRKDNYIAEIMKGIRIYSEQQTINGYPRYQIVFENVYKIGE